MGILLGILEAVMVDFLQGRGMEGGFMGPEGGVFFDWYMRDPFKMFPLHAWRK